MRAARAELRHIGSVMGSRVGSEGRERGVCHTRAKDRLGCMLARKSSERSLKSDDISDVSPSMAGCEPHYPGI